MNKIPTVFVRDPENRRHVTREVTPGCEWVLAGEGRATRKYDGTCVAMLGGTWWTRREVKAGKPLPKDFEPVSHDETTGKTVGWEPADESPFWKYLVEAINGSRRMLTNGTYELCGPKVNGNPEGFEQHVLVRHDTAEYVSFGRTYDDLAVFLTASDIEGIVFHHPDGRMAKIKRRDFARA